METTRGSCNYPTSIIYQFCSCVFSNGSKLLALAASIFKGSPDYDCITKTDHRCRDATTTRRMDTASLTSPRSALKRVRIHSTSRLQTFYLCKDVRTTPPWPHAAHAAPPALCSTKASSPRTSGPSASAITGHRGWHYMYNICHISNPEKCTVSNFVSWCALLDANRSWGSSR